jgi:2-methylcitrate dehydratase PrpD
MGLAVRQNAMQSGRNNLFKIFGPTAAVARALRLAPEQVRHALGISFSHAVGDAQCALDGALTLRLQQGIVAQGALISGLLAEKGFTGAREFLLGRWGYLSVWEPEPRLQFLTDGIGQDFYGEQITIKPFSSCRATHPSIDLSMTLARENDLNADAIGQIKIRTSPEIHNLVAYPHETKCRPDSVPTAQFSIQYTVAAALLRGDMFLAELSHSLFKEKKINILADRIQVKPDSAMRTGSVLGRTSVEIHTKDGAVISGEIEHPLGSPKRPLDYDECGNKLLKCAEYAVHSPTPDQLDRLINRVHHLEELDDVSALMTDLY